MIFEKNTQSEDHKASGVRDLPPALRVARKRLNGSVSGAVLFFTVRKKT